MTDFGYLAVLTLGGVILSARLGAGLLLHGGPPRILFPAVVAGYVLLGFCLGYVSDSRAAQAWLAWLLEGDRVVVFQAAEIFLCFVMIRIAVHLQSPAGAVHGRPRRVALLPPLLALSPFVCIWGLFSVGIIQKTWAGWAGEFVGMAVFGASLLCACSIFLIGKLARAPVTSTVPVFILLNLLVAAFAVFIPAAINLPAVEALSFSFPMGRTVLIVGLMVLVVGLGFISRYRRITPPVPFHSRRGVERTQWTI